MAGQVLGLHAQGFLQTQCCLFSRNCTIGTSTTAGNRLVILDTVQMRLSWSGFEKRELGKGFGFFFGGTGV
jgi:hypothetical protein